MMLSSSGPGPIPGPRSGPGPVQVRSQSGPDLDLDKSPGPGLTLNLVCHHHPPDNFYYALNDFKRYVNQNQRGREIKCKSSRSFSQPGNRDPRVKREPQSVIKPLTSPASPGILKPSTMEPIKEELDHPGVRRKKQTLITIRPKKVVSTEGPQRSLGTHRDWRAWRYPSRWRDRRRRDPANSHTIKPGTQDLTSQTSQWQRP